jgi:glycosyltransferase involved in cell wall biosynthesis
MPMADESGRHERCPHKIVFVLNHAAFFVSHRLPLALAAREHGYDATLVTGHAGSESMEPAAVEILKAQGITHTRVAFTASGMNPFVEAIGLLQLIKHLRKVRPSLVHCASPKGILYGAIAARLARVRGLVLAISGMGFAFTQASERSLLRSAASWVYRALARFAYGHPNKVVIVQNIDDQSLVVKAGLAQDSEVVRIPGSGVDLQRLSRTSIASKSEIVLFPARMLLDKGVLEFIEAARIVRRTAPTWRFVMAGAADYENPRSVSADCLRQFQAEGLIEWLGHVWDMGPLYEEASIVCLPSYYREGMPKALLEAAAAGCAVVTADTTGCREAIVAGVTGDLVPPRDVDALAEVLRGLVADRARRESYGAEGRRLAKERFGIDAVIARVLEIYKDLLRRGPASA